MGVARVGTVDSNTSLATATAYGNQRKEDRTAISGVLWALDFSLVSSNYNVNLTGSTDNGATWSLSSNITFGSGGPSYPPSGDLHIDLDDNAHVVLHNAYSGIIHYFRGTPNAARTAWTWSSSLTLSNNAFYDTPSVVAHRDPAGSGGWFAHVFMGNQSSQTAGAYYSRVTITSAGAISATSGPSTPPLQLSSNGATGVNGYPCGDFRHTGDGKTVAGSSPDLFVGWSAGQAGSGYGIRFKKATYSGGSWTWGTEREIDNAHYIYSSGYWLNCIFDGTRVVIAGTVTTSGGSYSDVVAHERDAADTTTTSRVLSQESVDGSAAALFAGSVSYDTAANLYLFGRNNASGNPLVVRKWTRSGASYGAATVLDSAVGNNSPYCSARRGSSGARIDYVYTKGASSPYAVISGAVVLNTAPNAPTLTAPGSGASIDRTIAESFTWTFSDPDAGDSESAFDLQYRVQGTSTWTTVSQTTTATSYTFAANTFTAGATYEWQVRTYDSQGAVGPWSSSSFFTAATPPAAPTITAPNSGATISAASSTVTWSAPSQAHYEVRRVGDLSGSPDTSTVYWDSGDAVDATSRALSVAFPTNGRTEHIQVRIQTNGIWSPWADARVVVSYTPPAAPTVALTPFQASASLLVTITNPTPTGGQPALDHNDVYINDGDGKGLTRRATGITNNGTWPYGFVVSGRDYSGGNVQVIAVATNGTTTTGSS